MIVLVITGAAVTLLLIGEAVPTLRGDVVLVADAEQQYGENVSIVNVPLIIIIMMSFRYLWHLHLIIEAMLRLANHGLAEGFNCTIV